ncbi:hypothetical protein [Burkholderia vietnamiensis]|uniref:hypothetical protein n=1 Tax=Burkholderia vietnamiensis TaxID=60552 RepID=UPI0015941A87|nr:hypothetical protein [Burkholderia vietnamiensis]
MTSNTSMHTGAESGLWPGLGIPNWKAATYRPEVGRMAGNEFIEALNPLPDDDLAFKALRATVNAG